MSHAHLHPSPAVLPRALLIPRFEARIHRHEPIHTGNLRRHPGSLTDDPKHPSPSCPAAPLSQRAPLTAHECPLRGIHASAFTSPSRPSLVLLGNLPGRFDILLPFNRGPPYSAGDFNPRRGGAAQHGDSQVIVALKTPRDRGGEHFRATAPPARGWFGPKGGRCVASDPGRPSTGAPRGNDRDTRCPSRPHMQTAQSRTSGGAPPRTASIASQLPERDGARTDRPAGWVPPALPMGSERRPRRGW